jgi:GTPase involved in cell partitioning and DNA repair
MEFLQSAQTKENPQEVIRQLQAEILRLKEQLEKVNSGGVVVLRKTVTPKDYEQSKKRLAELEEENENLKCVLSFSGVYSLEALIEDFNNDLQLKLKRIAKEFQNFPLGLTERELIRNTVIHLHKCAQAMEELLK